MQCGKANTYSIAREFSKANGKTFKTNKISVCRFLPSKKYIHIIVVDHGFGRQRFANFCKENGFEYIAKNNIKKTIHNKSFKHKINLSIFRLGCEAVYLCCAESMMLLR